MSFNTSINMTFSTTEWFYNLTDKPKDPSIPIITIRVLCYFCLLICLLGLVGNGSMMCQFSFKLKRNQSTVYFLNLAIADFFYLVGFGIFISYMTFYFHFVYMPATNDQCISKISQIFCSLNFDASYFLLTAISMERSVSILYPFYNNTSRPTHQSAIVCGSLWILAILIMVLEVFVCNDGGNYLSTGSEYCFSIIIFTTVLFVMAILLMLFSSILLLIEIQKTSKYCRPPKLYIVVLLTLLIFFISVIPARVLKLLIMLEANRFTSVSITFFFVHYLCTAIYCSANPYVNVLVGRWGKVTTIKKAVEEIFQDIN